MSDIVVIVKYAMVFVLAVIMEYLVTLFWNEISPLFNIPTLNGSIMLITIPITVLIFVYFLYKDTIYPQQGQEYEM
jgi:TRAP-type C4-dicarboxylate transport system permease small subunit